MAEKGQHGFAGMDDERHREVSREGGHASHEKGNAHEFNEDEAAEAGRRGAQARQMAHANREAEAEGGMMPAEDRPDREGAAGGGTADEGAGQPARSERARKTRGGTHDQHVHAGKKGGSRIRELIELGYKYEQEHGIGPGRNERSRNAAARREARTRGGQAGANQSNEPAGGADRGEG